MHAARRAVHLLRRRDRARRAATIPTIARAFPWDVAALGRGPAGLRPGSARVRAAEPALRRRGHDVGRGGGSSHGHRAAPGRRAARPGAQRGRRTDRARDRARGCRDATGSMPVLSTRAGGASPGPVAIVDGRARRRDPAAQRGRHYVSRRATPDRFAGAASPYTSPPVADLPIDLETGLSESLARILDVEGKIPRAIEALGPVEGRDVVVVDGSAGLRARQLTELGARVTLVDSSGPAPFAAPDELGRCRRRAVVGVPRRGRRRYRAGCPTASAGWPAARHPRLRPR